MKWAARVSPSDRPAILNQTHADWPFLLRWVPRSWSSWFGDPPRKIAGNAADTSPIPVAGTWLLTLPFYVALTTRGGWHARLGMRWDDVDRYYAISATIKRVTA